MSRSPDPAPAGLEIQPTVLSGGSSFEAGHSSVDSVLEAWHEMRRLLGDGGDEPSHKTFQPELRRRGSTGPAARQR